MKKRIIGPIALLITTGAFAQTAPPKAAKKPPVQVKPQPPMGCKLVGTVKGTKVWAGDCIATPAVEIPLPASPPAEPGDERPSDTKP
ncbi:hypothetical protein ABIB94_007478 [Bradyrhizobium sp. JR7.2]